MFNALGETYVYGSAIAAAAAFHFWSRRFVGFLVIGVHHDFSAGLDTFPNWESHYRSCDRILLLLHSYASNASIAAQETKASEADHHQCLTANSSSSTAAIPTTATTSAPASSSSSSSAASSKCFHLCAVLEPTTAKQHSSYAGRQQQTSITPTSSLLPVVPIHQSRRRLPWWILLLRVEQRKPHATHSYLNDFLMGPRTPLFQKS